MKHVLHVFATFAPGGPQVRAAQLLARLGPGVRHTLVAMDGCYDALTRLPPGLDVLQLAPPPRAGFLRTGREFAARLRQEAPDLLLTYNWGAIEALLGARLARLRAVVHHEDGFGREEAERQLRRRVWARRLLLPGARALIVPSQVLARIASTSWRQPATRIRLLPNGVDLQSFRPTPRAPATPLVVGSVAAFRGEKNQAMLLRAFAHSQQAAHARLVLVGDGPERPACEQLARELGIAARVEFRGAVAATAPVYAGFDLFALSSRTEQMPLVVLEAMACGLPIAAPTVGDVEAMVGARNRPFLVPFLEPEALAVSLDALLADAELRREIGVENRARCEREYELGACLDRYLAVYREVGGL